jgi:anti-sigma factor RsiW
VTCREFADFMIDYLSGELPSAIRVRFDDHLRACKNCQRYLKCYEQSVRLGQCAFDDLDAVVPAEVPEALVQAILAARRTRG